MSLHHHHDHAHEHHHNHQSILIKSLVLILSFMLIEYAGGLLFNSLALIADAGHMLNDSFSMILALFTLTLQQYSQKLSRFLTLINGLSLIAIAVYIIIEAIHRWQNPQNIQVIPMLIIASIGLIVNFIVARFMMTSQHDNLNMRAVYLHVLADLAGSMIAIIAGLCAYFFAWQWVDILGSAILSVFILYSGLNISHRAMKNIQHLHHH